MVLLIRVSEHLGGWSQAGLCGRGAQRMWQVGVVIAWDVPGAR